MAFKDFNDTSIPQSISSGLYSEKQYNIAKQHVWKILDTIINGTTEMLRSIKSQQHPVIYQFKNQEDFLLAAYVQFIPNEEDPNMPGNWTYTWTFNEDDLPMEGARICSPYDGDLLNFFWTYGTNKHNCAFKMAEWQGDCFNYIISSIIKWLDENAVEGEVVGVTLENVVDFTVAIEDGEKVMACEVYGEIKKRIKDDAGIEK